MTIIQPKRNRSFFSPFIVLELGAVIVFAFLNVLMYNYTVNLRNAIMEQERLIANARALNADMKKMVYRSFDAALIRAVSEEKGFVKIGTPRYLLPS